MRWGLKPKLEQLSCRVCKPCGVRGRVLTEQVLSPAFVFILIMKDNEMHSNIGALKYLTFETYVICSSTKLQRVTMTSMLISRHRLLKEEGEMETLKVSGLSMLHDDRSVKVL